MVQVVQVILGLLILLGCQVGPNQTFKMSQILLEHVFRPTTFCSKNVQITIEIHSSCTLFKSQTVILPFSTYITLTYLNLSPNTNTSPQITQKVGVKMSKPG